MKLVKDIKQAGQDFEFYPTTNEIIEKMVSSFPEFYRGYSFLDIGAGNGKVLEAVNATKKYAIEKSQILASQMPKDVLFCGSDFEQQTLFDIVADVTFSNPPYSRFVEWVVKILTESRSEYIYLVIPNRWRNNLQINTAIKERKASFEILGEFDFLESEDREARAVVDLIQIKTPNSHCDRFESFVANQFPKPKEPSQEEVEFQETKANLSKGEDYLERLVSCYNTEREKLQNTYLACLQLDCEILAGLEIDPKKLATLIREKLQTLRDAYWRMIFDKLDVINDRFTTKNKREFITTLLSNTHVEFIEDNVRMIVHWMIGQANRNIDKQLVQVWESMIELCNVTLYKSNKRTFGTDSWRFRNQLDENAASHFKLDLRIVAHYCGGIHQGWSYQKRNGINERANDFLSDLRVVAINLGYLDPTKLSDLPEWTSGKKQNIEGTHDGEREVIAEIKAFKNQNLHIKFSRKFLCSLNCEYGKIKGWLLNGEQAAEELNEPMAVKIFEQSHRLSLRSLPPLLSAPKN